MRVDRRVPKKNGLEDKQDFSSNAPNGASREPATASGGVGCLVAISAFVDVPGLGAFRLAASSFTPIEPLLFHLSQIAVPHGVLVAIGAGDRCRLA